MILELENGYPDCFHGFPHLKGFLKFPKLSGGIVTLKWAVTISLYTLSTLSFILTSVKFYLTYASEKAVKINKETNRVKLNSSSICFTVNCLSTTKIIS